MRSRLLVHYVDCTRWALLYIVLYTRMQHYYQRLYLYLYTSIIITVRTDKIYTSRVYLYKVLVLYLS